MKTRNYKTGEFFLAKEEIKNAKGEVLVPVGDVARIMVYDPSKEPTPYGIRTEHGHITQVYVGEEVMTKDPSRAHETPIGFED